MFRRRNSSDTSRDELLGQKVKNIIPEGFAERLIADGTRTAAEALAQQIGTGIELNGRRKDGSEFPIEIMLSPLESADGILVTAAIRDITMRKKAEADLVQESCGIKPLERGVGPLRLSRLPRLAGTAAHGHQLHAASLQRYKGNLDSDADEFIAFALDGATRMQLMIRDLLAYSRIDPGETDLLDVSGEEALQRALTNLRGDINESGALVTHDPLPHVLADKAQLVQLFQNLVGNAIKFRSDDVPKVHVSAVEKWRGALGVFGKGQRTGN